MVQKLQTCQRSLISSSCYIWKLFRQIPHRILITLLYHGARVWKQFHSSLKQSINNPGCVQSVSSHWDRAEAWVLHGLIRKQRPGGGTLLSERLQKQMKPRWNRRAIVISGGDPQSKTQQRGSYCLTVIQLSWAWVVVAFSLDFESDEGT